MRTDTVRIREHADHDESIITIRADYYTSSGDCIEFFEADGTYPPRGRNVLSVPAELVTGVEVAPFA